MAMRHDEYASLDAVAMAALVRKGDVTPAELLECAIARAEAVNGRLNAIVYKGYDDARQAAAKVAKPTRRAVDRTSFSSGALPRLITKKASAPASSTSSGRITMISP